MPCIKVTVELSHFVIVILFFKVCFKKVFIKRNTWPMVRILCGIVIIIISNRVTLLSGQWLSGITFIHKVGFGYDLQSSRVARAAGPVSCLL